MTTLTPTAVLLRAAELIEKCGWRQEADPDDARLILREAMAGGITGLPWRRLDEHSPEWAVYSLARDAFLSAAGWSGLLDEWAEVPGRTQDDVVDMLRRAAVSAA